MEPEVQVDLIAAGGHAQGSDDGEPLVSARALRQERSMAAVRRASSDKGGHQKAGFVEEDEAGSQAGGFFFTRGRSSLTQRWISASSRSTARRCGFPGLRSGQAGGSNLDRAGHAPHSPRDRLRRSDRG